MESLKSCNFEEIDLKNVNRDCKHSIFLYTIDLNCKYTRCLFIDVQLVDMNIIQTPNGVKILFKFTESYEKRQLNLKYKKFHESYNLFIYHPKQNILEINYSVYFLHGDENSREIFQTTAINISNFPEVHRFLHFLYTKHKNNFTKPVARY